MDSYSSYGEGFGQSAGCSGISAKNKNTGKNAFDTRKSSNSSDDKTNDKSISGFCCEGNPRCLHETHVF